ncbi:MULTISPECIES: hypothetical protein [Streptomyces]|uniref:Uncharacterized protein n=1 Tax=Streptomyces solicathayae TaxID=3081768 RepID=A0ABZ0LVN2_9ACTN|nr:hypothetical protein [Streptomyces sp. HUAS YS2]WOX23390.1 hypothetical protein R2D22_19135 [Streptomyces sp. HUAS YS2]
MNYRYWCGECSFKTPWLRASEGERLQLEHYAGRHPGTPPGGQVEVRRGDPDGGCGRQGCLALAAVALVLLVVAAAFLR